MIRILIVEDESAKAKSIEDAIRKSLDHVKAELETVTSAHAAGAALRRTAWDLMVLDLNIPRRDGEASAPDGGAEFLRQIQGRRDYSTPTHVIGISAYENLVKRYGDLFADLTWALIEYDPASDRWSQRLT